MCRSPESVEPSRAVPLIGGRGLRARSERVDGGGREARRRRVARVVAARTATRIVCDVRATRS